MGSDRLGSFDSIEQAIRRVGRGLTEAGIEGASGDARRLIAATLCVPAEVLIRDPGRLLTRQEQVRLDDYVRRRVAREPVSRILGEREFYGRPFTITPAVLDPRPDTETLIDVVLDMGRRQGWHKRPVRILDIGTGSGAILLTLLAEFPAASGLGLDISKAALDCAAANAIAQGSNGRASFEQCDVMSGVPHGYDLVVSNPPYIVTSAIADLEPEVADFDPRIALDGGGDGLIFYRSILASWSWARGVSNAQQSIVLEIGAGQSESVVNIARDTGACEDGRVLSLHRDLGGHVRCVAIEAHPATLVQKNLEPR